MTSCNQYEERPATITCPGCGDTREVGARGVIPDSCVRCAHAQDSRRRRLPSPPTRPSTVKCQDCGATRPVVRNSGPLPTRCESCAGKAKRHQTSLAWARRRAGEEPETGQRSYTCESCQKPKQTGSRGPLPRRCPRCAYTAALTQTRESRERRAQGAPLRPRGGDRKQRLGRKAERELLGPDCPLLGMSAQQYSAWRRQRAVELYLAEPELSVLAISERLGMDGASVTAALARVGILNPRRNHLPAGPPSPG